jgi:HEPN domain-containing protein
MENLEQKYNEYIKTYQHYLENAEKMYATGNYRKASEFFWGAIALSIKTLAFLSSKAIGKHCHFTEFVKGVSKETDDSEYYDLFKIIERLHFNFYDEEITIDDYPYYREKTMKFLEKNNTLIQQIIEKKGNLQ